MKKVIKSLSIIISIIIFFQILPIFAVDIATIKITPEVSCVKLGDTITFKANAYSENGSIISDVEFEWVLSGVGTIVSKTQNTATYKAHSPGKVTITAYINSKSGSVSFTVGSPKVNNVKIRVDPDIAGEVADYFITFETDECGILQPGDKIYIAFPKGTVFPKYYQCNVLTVNGIPSSFEVSEDKDSSPVIIITVPNGMPFVTYVYVRICKVINPRGGACYLIAVATSKQTYWSMSNPYSIRGSIITPPTVEVKPNIVGEIAEYNIKFKTSSSGRLSSCYGGYIFIEFPVGTYVPQDIPIDSVTVNGVVCAEAKPEVNGRVVKVYPGMVVMEDSDVVVRFTLEAGVRNPEKPQDYTLTVWTSSDTIHVDSTLYKIMASKIEDVTVIIDKPYINTPSAYTIKFKTGLVGKLNIGAQITIYFPQTTTLPKNSRAGDIIVNNVHTIKPSLIQGTYTLIIFSPVEIPAKSEVEIYIPEDFGITNPPEPRKYKLEIHTAKEGTNVLSNEFMIGPSVVGDVKVSLSLPYINVSSDIELNFKTGGGGRLLKEKDRIFVVFPKGTFLPNYIDKNSVFIQGKELEINPFIKKEDFEIILNVPIDIPANEYVNVKFSNKSKILNPKSPGEYIFKIATSREVSYVSSPPISITESTVKDVTLDILNNTILERCNIRISFYTGEAGYLSSKDKIILYFSKGFNIPSTYNKGISLNNEELSNLSVTYNPDLLKVEITVNKEIQSGEKIIIDINEKALITNPKNAGNYNIGISTNKEPKIVPSSDFRIIPLPTTKINIDPSNPDGNNDWYRTEPEVSFSVNSENHERVKTFYSLDGKDFIEYVAPFKISSGTYEIQFFSQHSEFAVEETKKYELNIDAIPPIIDLIEEKIYTNKTKYSFSFAIIESNLLEIRINNKIYDALDGKVNPVLDLIEGENIFSIKVIDKAGNLSSKEIIIILDTSPPNLEIIKPLPWSRTIRKKIRIEGNTDPDAIATINGKTVPNENGKINSYYTLSPGLNILALNAVDVSGNIKNYYLPITYYENFTVKLIIGSKSAQTSFGKVEFDAPPYIKNGFTMVPLRFYAELLDCEINFESVFQIITIRDSYGREIIMQVGNKIATVNGEKKLLSVEPEIKNGRTFVPLRFIAEEFDFTIEYVKNENAVIIEYNGDQ